MLSARLPRPLRLALYAGAVGVVLFLCLAPSQDVPGEGLVWDKAEHSVTWAILTFLGLALSSHRPRAIALFALALGGAIEVLQATMGFGRDGDWRDFAADAIGVAAALGLYAGLRRLGGRR